jgi:lipocalin
MAAPIYVVRRAPTCEAETIEKVLNALAAEGYELVDIIHHSTVSSPFHNGRFCVIDVIGVKK